MHPGTSLCHVHEGYSWARDCQGTKEKYGGSGAKYWRK